VLDFPSSPVVGQTFPEPPVEGVPVWRWDGVKWVRVAGDISPPGIEDAPETGEAFGRMNGAWEEVLPIAGGALTGRLDPMAARSNVADPSEHMAGLEVLGTETTAAMVGFHRVGEYGAYLGVDVDNQLRYGGWSLGAAGYRLWHEGNLTPADFATEARIWEVARSVVANESPAPSLRWTNAGGSYVANSVVTDVVLTQYGSTTSIGYGLSLSRLYLQINVPGYGWATVGGM
jgi:hypothetical protein